MMDWLGEAFGLVGTLFGAWQARKARKLSKELDAIRTKAGTKARWE